MLILITWFCFRLKSNASQWWDWRLDWDISRPQRCCLERLSWHQCSACCLWFRWLFSVWFSPSKSSQCYLEYNPSVGVTHLNWPSAYQSLAEIIVMLSQFGCVTDTIMLACYMLWWLGKQTYNICCSFHGANLKLLSIRQVTAPFMACLNQFRSIICLAASEVLMDFVGNMFMVSFKKIMFMVVFIYSVPDVLRICTKRN